jgi:hypothetical protein
MSTKHRSKLDPVPQQLIGVFADAVRIGATSFRLQPNPPYIMASISAGMRAMEIDFESWSGKEMIEFLVGQISDREHNTGSFVMDYGNKLYPCEVIVERVRNPHWLEVRWTCS